MEQRTREILKQLLTDTCEMCGYTTVSKCTASDTYVT